MKNKNTVVYIIAGEVSGDFIGSKLMKQLKLSIPNIKFYGIGGSLMEQEGLSSLFPMHKLSIMGVTEVIRKIFSLKKLINETVQNIMEVRPDILITIDSLGFNKRVAKSVKKQLNIPLVHYVAPTVWVWKPKRAKEMAKIFSYILCLFDFEPIYFTKEGMKAYFVGHPIIESDANKQFSVADMNRFYAKYNLNRNAQYIIMLPGSRKNEVKSMLPIFDQSFKLIKQVIPNAEVILPTVPHMYDYINNYLKEHNLNYTLINNNQDKYSSFKVAKFAIATSGTVSLELAMANLPMVISYKSRTLTYLLARYFFKLKYLSIVNIISNKEIIKEYLQHEASALNISEYVINNINNKSLPHQEEINSILEDMGYNRFIPSHVAAQIVTDILDHKI